MRDLYPHTFPVKVEHLENRFFVRRLVQADIAYLFQQREIDDAGSVFLVMQHQFVKAVVLLAAKGESAVILFDKLDGLAHFIFRKAGLLLQTLGEIPDALMTDSDIEPSKRDA